MIPVVRQIQPGVHQEVAAIDLAGFRVPVLCVFIQALKAKLCQAGAGQSILRGSPKIGDPLFTFRTHIPLLRDAAARQMYPMQAPA